MTRGITELESAAQRAGKQEGRFVQSYDPLNPRYGVTWFPLDDLGSNPDTTRGIHLGMSCAEAMENLHLLPDAEPAQPKTAPVVPISPPKGRRRSVKEAQDG